MGDYVNQIKLVIPTKYHENEIIDYKAEHLNSKEYDIHGGALLEKMSYDDWLLQLKNNSNEKTVNPEWVVSSTFYAIRKKDDKIIGMIDIRHTLNQFLSEYGGHIGFGVRPSERNNGYAIQILKLGLEYCKKLGLQKVMLACYKDNLASSKTIKKCGGVLEKEYLHADGKIVQVFWISLG